MLEIVRDFRETHGSLATTYLFISISHELMFWMARAWADKTCKNVEGQPTSGAGVANLR